MRVFNEINSGFSVLLSVYYKEESKYLHESLISIWDDQTLKPTQIVLVQDGPLTAELDAVIAEWQDKLGAILTIVSLEQNVGLGAALNIGLQYCKNELVARMDTDDIAMPTRFEKQIKAFCKDSELDILGSYTYLFSEALSEDSLRKVPIEHDVLISNLWACPLVHPSVMFKKSSLLKVGAYNPNLKRRQDYELWFRCAIAGLRFANLAEPLLYYRFSEQTHKRQSTSKAWQQGMIGFKGSRSLNLAYWKCMACFVPFLRSLFPTKAQHYIYLALNRFDPRRV